MPSLAVWRSSSGKATSSMRSDLVFARRRRTPASRTARRCCRLAASSLISSSRHARQVGLLAAGRCRPRPGSARSFGALTWRSQHLADAQADALGRPAQVGLEDLADVHPRRNAQRVQHDVGRRAVGHVGHVLDRHDARDHALVAVAAGHLVAGLQAALDGQVDLDHLQHARRQLVALRELLALLLEGQVELVALLLHRFLQRFELVGRASRRPAGLRTSGSGPGPAGIRP